MSWSFPIVRIGGTEVRIHLTFFILLAWIGFSHYQLGGGPAAVSGLILICSVFLCVLLHEFGHVTAARLFGIRTPDITLLPIGGVARLERMPEKPAQELIVAVAGPLVNVVIALTIFLIRGHVNPQAFGGLESPEVNLWDKLLLINITLVVFNLIPAFPMDGGRIFRAFLAMGMPYAKATRIAAVVGQFVAFLLGFWGLMAGNPLMVFVAFFVYLGAGQEAAHVQTREMTRGLRAKDAMMTNLVALRPYSTLDEAAEALLRTAQTEFPVLNNDEGFTGVLTRNDLIQGLREAGQSGVVERFMIRDVREVGADHPLEMAMEAMSADGTGLLAVQDESGRFLGLITMENLSEMVLVRGALPPEEHMNWAETTGQKPSGGNGAAG